MNSSSLKKLVTEFKREKIRELLLQCTDNQIEVFNMMYGSVSTIPDEKMYRAYDQCLATIRLNQEQQRT